MAVIQDTFASAPPVGFPGMVANGETSNRISRTCEDATGIAFGAPAYKGVGDRGCTKVVGAIAAFYGFAIADHGVQPLPGGVAADVYPRYASVGILTAGAIYVTVGENVTDGAAVFITAGGAIVATPGANIAATGWVFDDTVTNGGVCRIVRR